MRQKYTSAMTSINSTKLPAIYKKIDWEQITKGGEIKTLVIDYGCGRYPDQIALFLRRHYPQIYYYGYDPFWKVGKADPLYVTRHWTERMANKELRIVVLCSNVLNVIAEDEIVKEVKEKCYKMSPYCFFTVYEGDKTGVGKPSKRDCYQRNQKLSDYITLPTEGVRKEVLCDKALFGFIR